MATNAPAVNGHMNAIGPVSPARSLSPNPLSVAIMNGASNANNLSSRAMPSDSYFYSGASNPIANNATNMNTNMYSPPHYGRNLFDSTNPYASSNGVSLPTNTNNIGTNSSFYSNNFGNIGNGSKYSPYMDTSSYYGMPNGQQQQQTAAAIERAAVF